MKKLQQYSFNLARRAQKIANSWAAQYWHSNPLGKEPHAPSAVYEALWDKEKAATYPEIDEFEKNAGFAVDKNWMDDLARQTQIVIKSSPLCYQHGRILYSQLRQYLNDHKDIKALKIIETGTARSFSSLTMAKALNDHKRHGTIVTFDLLPHHKPIFWNCIADHDGPQSRAQLLKKWNDLIDAHILYIEGDSRINLNKIGTGRIHFAFLDGAHGYRDVVDEFKMVTDRQQSGDIIVFDDYNDADFPGVVKAVDEGCLQYGYDKHVITCGRDRAYVIATKL